MQGNDSTRRLAAGERANHALDFAAPMSFTTIAHLRGPLTGEMLRTGLDAVQARHPLLRVGIVDGEPGPSFCASSLPVPLRLVAGGDWITALEEELAERLPTRSGPLMRCVAVADSPDHHTVLLTFHHAISDGMSGVFLMRDLLRAATGEPGPPLTDTLPIEQRLPPYARGVRGWLHTLQTLARGLMNALKGKALRVRRDAAVPTTQRRSSVIHKVLDAATMTTLSERARREGVTVHSALAAAMLQAVLDDAGGSAPVRLALSSSVSLRKLLAPPVGEDLGYFVSLVSFNAWVSAGDSFWSLARSHRAQTASRMRPGPWLGGTAMLDQHVRRLTRGGAGPDEVADRLESTLPSTALLTNLGRLDLESRYGPLTLEQLHFAPNTSALNDWVSSAASFGGALVWNFIWPAPLFSRPRAEALVARTLARLHAAIED